MHTTLVSTAELAQALGDPKLVIIDCRFSLMDTDRGENDFSAVRIPGAQYAHLDRDLSSNIISGVTGRHPLPDREALATRFRQWGISNDSQIVAYDDNIGAIAARFWWLGRWLGHAAVAVLDGGMAAWQQAGLELETGQSQTPAAGDFNVGDALEQTVEKQAVAEPSHTLLDAREAERYRGEQEPIDVVAGHIPGALNNPFQSNIDPQTKRFKPAAELRRHYEQCVQDAGNKPLVHYCGSGVTAAHNMLAMRYAGLEAGKLYAGSFSEWISAGDVETYPVEQATQSGDV